MTQTQDTLDAYAKMTRDVVIRALPASKALLLTELDKLLDGYAHSTAGAHDLAVINAATNLRALLLAEPYDYGKRNPDLSEPKQAGASKPSVGSRLKTYSQGEPIK